jgi:alpha-1,6-mannosyltransferase
MVIAAASEAGGHAPLGLVIVGDGMDRARIERAAARSPHVHLAGAIRDRQALASVLASADGLVHGGDAETFGLVPAEALASGLPLVLPDRSGSAQLADPAFTESYRSGDTASAAAAIARLLARDPGTLKAAARQAAAKVRSDAEHFAQLFEHFTELAGRRTQHAIRLSPAGAADWAPAPEPAG